MRNPLNAIAGRTGDAFHPRVFGRPEALTQSLFYRAELRLPQPPLPAARGRATPMYIRTSTAAGGQLVLGRDQFGNTKYSVVYPNVPVDR